MRKVEEVKEKEMKEIVEENKEREVEKEEEEEQYEEEVLCWGGQRFKKPCEKRHSWPRHPQGSEKMALLFRG